MADPRELATKTSTGVAEEGSICGDMSTVRSEFGAREIVLLIGLKIPAGCPEFAPVCGFEVSIEDPSDLNNLNLFR